MKYDYQSLDALRNECILKVANGSGDAYTAQIGMAASYALDLIDICKDNNVTLALNMATEENVLKGIALTHQYNLSHGKSATKSREDTVKKVGGYELFTVFNGISDASDNVKIDYILGGLQIVLKNTDGSVIRFNPQREIENTLKKFRLSSAGDELRVSGTLQPFYDSLTKDFLSKAN